VFAVRVSCPARVDIGNKLDYPSYFLSMPSQTTKTANIALELRTSISFSPSPRNCLSIVTDSITEQHHSRPDPAKSQFPILCSLINHFGLKRGKFRIESQVPLSSGLGGSAMLIVSLIALIRKLQCSAADEGDWPSLVLIAHLFENWLGYSSTGFQDQLAALHGGANLWTWGTHFESSMPIYSKDSIMPEGGAEELGRHVLLCYTGQSHRRNRSGKQFRGLSDKEVPQWTKVSYCTDEFAAALKNSDWISAGRLLNAECNLREQIDPTCLSRRAKLLVAAGRECGLGCRYAGHGHGGCVWAIGKEDSIRAVNDRWRQMIRQWKGAWVITPKIAAKGLIFD
jgi:D-glycero-alpha-D-manno-heptose-7-phosphate kinase